MSNVLNYKTYGDPKNTALLLVHAMGADLRFWEECVPQWESKFYCITPDLRAAGKSPTLFGSDTIREPPDAPH